MSSITVSRSNGTATITIDRNARGALLAALSLRLRQFEDLPDALQFHARVRMFEARTTFERLWPVLDGLDFWEDEDPAATHTIPASDWLRALVVESAAETRQTIASETAQTSVTAQEGQAAFEKGGSHYKPGSNVHACVRQRGYFEWMRRYLEEQNDQLVCLEAILDHLDQIR
jgi:hypothetical protein